MFKPEFCPNPECQYHVLNTKICQHRWYSMDGFYISRVYGKVQRFKCKYCKHRFSEQTFSLNYYVKKPVNYKTILEGVISTSSISDLSRKIKVSPHTIINREKRLAAQAVAIHSRLIPFISINEPIVCDGFQSVVTNFYFPNNINIAVGQRSQFFYCLTYAQIKRAGRLNFEQQKKKIRYEKLHYINPNEIENSFSELIESIIQIFSKKKNSKLILFTDKKLEYIQALKKSCTLDNYKKTHQFSHVQISSKEPRTINNPLFPVNYMDRQFRKDLSEHVVKSICFGRNVNNQLERMVIYRFYHNFIKDYRTRNNSNTCHSDIAGIPTKLKMYYLNRFFSKKFFTTQIQQLYTDQKILNRAYITPMQKEYHKGKDKNTDSIAKIA